MVYKRNDDFIIKFGKNLRELRLEKKMTQEQIAESLDIDFSQYGKIERGLVNTSISNAYEISKVLEIELKELFNF